MIVWSSVSIVTVRGPDFIHRGVTARVVLSRGRTSSCRQGDQLAEGSRLRRDRIACLIG